MVSKLILGTAQLGLQYGINNTSGQPSQQEAYSILDFAYENGIRLIDTADAYGTSQQVIGTWIRSRTPKKFKILTKFSLGLLPLDQQLKNSLNSLGVEQVFCYSYHRFTDGFIESAIETLQSFKQSGLIVKTGISVYGNDELEKAIGMKHIDVIQLPFNLLDNRSLRGEWLKKAKEAGKELHCRSVFLQGLFFKDPKSLPEKLSAIGPALEKMHRLATTHKLEIIELALKYAFQTPEIENIIIGVERKPQLEQILQALNRDLPQAIIDEVSSWKVQDTTLIDPRHWT